MPHWKGLFGKAIHVVVPAELANEGALLSYLGLSAAELKKIWYYRRKMYLNFSISKRPNKVRNISAPDKRLKFLQRKLAAKLSELYRPRNPVHGFVVQRSVKTNALAHLRHRFIVNIDLEDFFPTISEKRVEGMLLSLGIDNRVAKIIAHICCNNNYLPQGAPSSPVLSNMICFRLDKNLMGVAKEARCIYTRYADDITFSSRQPPTSLFEATLPLAGRFSSDTFTPKLRGAFEHNVFVINPDKTHYSDRHSRRIVTGIKVNELLNVDRRYVRNIRAALYSVEMLGHKDAENKFHVKHGGRSDLSGYLRGKISFLSHIKGQSDPVVRGITLRFNNSFPTRPIKMMPTQAEILDRAVWVIESADNQGTAFFLRGVGLVTAAHCVSAPEEIEIFHPSKHANKFKVTVRTCSADRDLAILDHLIPTTEFFELDPTSRAVTRGDAMTAVGYPEWGLVDRLNIRPGVVTTCTSKHGIQLIEVQQKLADGMSGGPLLDADGAVAGIIHKGGPDEGRDFAVHIAVLQDWLKNS